MSTDTPSVELDEAEADTLLDRLVARAEERDDIDLGRVVKSGINRRTFLGGVAAAAGIGAFTGNATAAPNYGNATGNAGTESQPFNNLYAKNGYLQSVSTDEVNNVYKFRSGFATADLQSVLNENNDPNSQGARIDIDTGQTTVSATVDILGRHTLQGAGIENTWLDLANGVNGSVIDYDPSDGNSYFFAQVRDLRIDGNKANNTSGHGIHTGRSNGSEANDFQVERVIIFRCAGHGMYIAFSWGYKIAHSLFEYNAKSGLKLDGTQAYLLDIFSSYNDEHGIEFNATGSTASLLRMQENGYSGINIPTAGENSTLSNIIAKNNTQQASSFYAGVFVDANNVRLNNVVAIDDQTDANGNPTPTQPYGLYIRGSNVVGSNIYADGNKTEDIRIDSGAADVWLQNVEYTTLRDEGTRTIINGRSQQAATPGSGVAADEWGGSETLANRRGVVVEDTSVTAPYDLYRADSAGNWVQIG